MIYYISYVSTAINALSEADLLLYLTKFKEKNTAKNLTGMLLYIEGTFIQTIEGEREVVEALYNKIKIDQRHKDVFLILSGLWKERKFNDWSMAFRSLSINDAKKISGFSNISELSLLSAQSNDEKHPALRLLQSFYDQLPLHQKLTDRISEN